MDPTSGDIMWKPGNQRHTEQGGPRGLTASGFGTRYRPWEQQRPIRFDLRELCNEARGQTSK